jgi:hypothetical protein
MCPESDGCRSATSRIETAIQLPQIQLSYTVILKHGVLQLFRQAISAFQGLYLQKTTQHRKKKCGHTGFETVTPILQLAYSFRIVSHGGYFIDKCTKDFQNYIL